MKALLHRLIDLRQDEGGIVLRSTITLFGLIAAHTMLETARDALFLERLAPSRLTLVYVILAGLALVASGANTRFVSSFGRRNALIFTLLGAAYGTVMIYLIPSSPAVAFGLYVWSGLLGTILVVQFWLLIGHALTVSQGKRLLGLIAAGGVLGAVVGASVSVGLLKLVSVHALLPVAAGLFLATAVQLTTFRVDNALVAAPSAGSEDDRPLAYGFGIFRENPYLVRLAVLIAIATAAVLTTDYLFKAVAARTLPAEELGDFFARYYALINSVALIFQVFISGAVVRRTGVLAAFSVLPLLLFTGGAATLLLGGPLAIVLLTKGADGALRHSMHRISSELLWMPVPEGVRARSKALIDTVVMRGTQAVVAGVILLLAMFGLDHTAMLAAIIVVLSAFWLVLTVGLRGPYLDLFRSALQRVTPGASDRDLPLDLRSVEVVVEALSSREPVRAIAAMDVLAGNSRSKLIPALILYHESDEVLLRALELVCTLDREDWIPLAERLLGHSREEVRVAALRALASTGHREAVEARMLDISPSVRAHAAFWLAHRADQPPIEHPSVGQILEMKDHAGIEAKIGLLEATAASGDSSWADVILRLCAVPEPRITEAAVKAISRVKDERFIPLLIDRLRYRELRNQVRDAMVALGEPALDALERAIENPRTHREVHRHLPRTISRFGTRRAADILLDRLEKEESGLVRYKVLRGLGRLVSETSFTLDRRRIEVILQGTLVEYLRVMSLWYPVDAALSKTPEAGKKSGELLVGLLEDKMEQALERAFRLLHLINPTEDLRSVLLAVRSLDRRVRAQALEFLDTLLLDASVSENRALFRVIADDLSVGERLGRAASFIPRAPKSYEQSLAMLIREKDDSVAGIAAYHALAAGIEDLRDALESVSKGRTTPSSLRSILELFERGRETPSVA